MKRSDFTLFWAIPPAQADYDNLIASGCERVMLTLQLARSRMDMLSRLAGLNRRVVIRIEQENKETPTQIAHSLSNIGYVVKIDAVIVGCEPEISCDMTYGSPDWCQQGAYASQPRLQALFDAIHGLGLMAVSPGLSHPPDAISEDGIPQPGRVSYREIVGQTYLKADGCGAHLYSLGWASEVDIIRFKFGLRWYVEHWHKPLWIDEVGVILSDDVEKMRAYTEMADVVMAGPCSERVMMFCPFISAGDPGPEPAWDSRYLIKDRAAYNLLGQWIAGGG